MAEEKQPIGFRTTSYPAIANPPLPAEGCASFSNYELAASIIFGPWIIQRLLPLPNGWKTYWFLVILLGVPIAVAYWTLKSKFGKRVNEKVRLPGKPISHYLDFKDKELEEKYKDRKIPMQIFHDAYFDKKVDFKGDVLDVMEYRHDWATFEFTPELFKYVFTKLIPDVIFHSQAQDEDQVRDHYDRGDDFYSWFLGPRMIYTGGVMTDISRQETLEELQDNKLRLVCEKLDLKEGDHMLDIGCGWGTLAAFAGKNYNVDVTGVTLARNQAAFGTQRLRENGVPEERGRILCMDYRDIPQAPGYYNKITCLEMAEHVGIRRYGKFLKEVYDLLADDGVMVFQVAGIRTCWQFEDLVWGLFMNKYVFPGADASCALNWVVSQLEHANFEIKSIDVLGVHYSATLHRWYQNWLSNKDKCVAKYGERWYRIWAFFLAYSVISSRQGSASVFQITCHKNLNGFHRVEGVPSHTSLHAPVSRKLEPVVSHNEMWE
ncbi:sphingolipid C9-methyltransferase [Cryptococcus neoformans var. grubii Br795]|uniref:sphingolipid C(9)-methyltransferase n=1 Tax=Cryptococcus neoformans Tu259-1 TaxID=1230072 RepID=A0A854Q5R3_CRYNE|nr:sphingolipid C9-methyltransferase [Cryptococcus neoformans var. grubii AD1-83a]OWZ50826.1 sphingolipid C9-methyltransferase [Cryptococcus neoformans var. grubii 125.91]OXG12895.1 sphingolipid C9-methyltransferase [Cryptococcus neoformans var. grubii Tu259-1]OXG27401.1 sphingolipid C9-methyltransferase [Cryptococcus neoformans var. grubii Bt15]OXG34241.1 sphingolipid C9-methyltransferase [Cryptococcus neoformans var. grubii Bt120]OXG45946.1 sphingolipid C9-methyltransferase [Cryptococcus neo